MPLFATLAGDDFTKSHLPEVQRIFSSDYSYDGYGSDSFGAEFYQIARFISRQIGDNPNIKLEEIFPNIRDDMKTLIQHSLDSYKINFKSVKRDELLSFEREPKIYRSYKALLSPVQGIALQYYDYNHPQTEINLTILIMIWSPNWDIAISEKASKKRIHNIGEVEKK